jgi:hypothetical protein
MQILACAIARAAPGFLHAGYLSAGPPFVPDVFLDSAGHSMLWIVAFLALGFVVLTTAWLARIFLAAFCGRRPGARVEGGKARTRLRHGASRATDRICRALEVLD